MNSKGVRRKLNTIFSADGWDHVLPMIEDKGPNLTETPKEQIQHKAQHKKSETMSQTLEFSQPHESLLKDSGDDRSIWVSGIGISFLCHLILFGALIFVPPYKQAQQLSPAVIDISIVKLVELEKAPASEKLSELETESPMFELKRPAQANTIPSQSNYPSSSGIDQVKKLEMMSVEDLNDLGFKQPEKVEVSPPDALAKRDFEHVKPLEPISEEGLKVAQFEKVDKAKVLSTADLDTKDFEQVKPLEPISEESAKVADFDQVRKPEVLSGGGLDKREFEKVKSLEPLPEKGPKLADFEKVKRPEVISKAYLDKRGFEQMQPLESLPEEGLNVGDSDQVRRPEVLSTASLGKNEFERIKSLKPVLAGRLDQIGFDQVKKVRMPAARSLNETSFQHMKKPGPLLAKGLDETRFKQLDKLKPFSTLEKVPNFLPIRTSSPQSKPAEHGALQRFCKVASTPGGAQVFIDGLYKGKAPLKIELPVGKYEVRLTLENYHDWEAQLLVLKDRKIPPISVRLMPREEYIEKRHLYGSSVKSE